MSPILKPNPENKGINVYPQSTIMYLEYCYMYGLCYKSPIKKFNYIDGWKNRVVSKWMNTHKIFEDMDHVGIHTLAVLITQHKPELTRKKGRKEYKM